LPQQRQCLLVDAVEIRPLLAVDFDVDEEVIHQRGDGGVLETLMGHDMAPMTGGITDREQDRLVLLLGARQCLRTPGLPMHGIFPVLEQIGAGFAVEVVSVHSKANVEEGAMERGGSVAPKWSGRHGAARRLTGRRIGLPPSGRRRMAALGWTSAGRFSRNARRGFYENHH
jgi:hypothetical protein